MLMMLGNKEIESIVINNKTVSTIHLNDELIYSGDITYTLSIYFRQDGQDVNGGIQLSGTVNNTSVTPRNFTYVNNAFTIALHAGDTYDFTFTHAQTGYEPSQSRIQGTMPNNDDSCTVIFEQQTYTLTLTYMYQDGTGAVNDITISGTIAGQNVTKSNFTQVSNTGLAIQCHYNDAFAITCTPPSGYTANPSTQSDSMPARPIGKNTILTSNQVPIIDDPFEPLL